MNNTVKSEKFRKLSIAALVTGILGYSLILIGMWFSIYDLFFFIICLS
jgi:hypothetical protein